MIAIVHKQNNRSNMRILDVMQHLLKMAITNTAYKWKRLNETLILEDKKYTHHWSLTNDIDHLLLTPVLLTPVSATANVRTTGK